MNPVGLDAIRMGNAVAMSDRSCINYLRLKGRLCNDDVHKRKVLYLQCPFSSE